MHTSSRSTGLNKYLAVVTREFGSTRIRRHTDVDLSVRELFQHSRDWCVAQNVLIDGLETQEARYLVPVARNLKFSRKAVEVCASANLSGRKEISEEELIDTAADLAGIPPCSVAISGAAAVMALNSLSAGL